MERISKQRGQGLVEFAVIFPIFALLMFAVIDGGLVMGRYNNINNAAKEGARLAAVGGTMTQIHDRVKAQAHGVLDTANTNCANYSSAPSAICVQWFTGPAGEPPGAVGSSIRVRVKYRYDPLTPLINLGDWTISECAIQRAERAVTNPPTVSIPNGTSPC